MLFFVASISSQNVGIGTEDPTQLLSVAGSIAVDHDNTNSGTPDNASLLFGTGPLQPAIFSSKSPGTSSTNGLDFWTNGERRMIIMEGGTVGINVQNPDPNYDFFVGGSMRTYTFNANSGTINTNFYINGDANIDEHVNINGSAYTPSYRLTVNDGHSYFGGHGKFTGYLDIDSWLSAASISSSGDIYSTTQVRGAELRATQYMAVGGVVDPTYRLRVYAGNSRFGGDVQVTGTLDTDDLETNTINGTGVVRSNGNSSLRFGFNQVGFTTTLSGGGQVDVTVSISDFEGGADDVRVFVSQFVPDPLPQYANWHDFSFHVHSVNPVNDTCKVRITNTTDGQLDIKGTLYLASVAKD